MATSTPKYYGLSCMRRVLKTPPPIRRTHEQPPPLAKETAAFRSDASAIPMSERGKPTAVGVDPTAVYGGSIGFDFREWLLPRAGRRGTPPQSDPAGLCGTAASLIAAGVAVDAEDAAAMLGRYKAPSRPKQQLLPRQEQQPPPTQRGTADGSAGAIASQGSRRS
ncbi:hypothetical protein HPB47_009642 [Ixodes persulcatus]|uniref:Uncharacterized protein n=1 Tax=Ixodes persulcatus TaxID=34615 RepID=A0AC60P184_IXOPE|nr:hypothetical protein HPB47_009642 [Ixodes persulcatus]